MTVARRSLHSVTLYRPEKAYNGFTLFTPNATFPSNTWLIDMQGRFVHRWQLPAWVRLHAELLPTGNLLCGLHDLEKPSSVPSAAEELVEMDWNGEIVWSYRDPYMDAHDRERMKNGNTLILKDVEVPKDLAAKVKGGVPGSEIDGVMFGHIVQEVTPEGKVVWEWIAHEHLDPELDALNPGGSRSSWSFNSLVELPDGNIMTCSPNTSNIHIINKATGDIKWRWGQGIISFAHDPNMLDNGNILVFDNGRFHVQPGLHPPDFSRVIEVNPSTNQIEWEYKAENPVDFYSTYISGCQRLPNGNTLICEGAMGRFFEVTPSGEMVWEYVVPFYAYNPVNPMTFGLNNRTFRCFRYGPDYPGLQGKKLDTEKLDLWNRLYGPDAFGQWARPSWRETERAPIAEEREPIDKRETVAYKESRPSVTVSKKRKVSSRLEYLGY